SVKRLRNCFMMAANFSSAASLRARLSAQSLASAPSPYSAIARHPRCDATVLARLPRLRIGVAQVEARTATLVVLAQQDRHRRLGGAQAGVHLRLVAAPDDD